MNKYNIQITGSSYNKLQKKLQQYGIKIGGMPIRNFLVANSTIVKDSTNTLGIRTKRIILHITGDFDSNPENLQNEMNLEINLRFAYKEYLLLRRRLDQLVKEYDKTSKISAKNVQDCRTVVDCIDLVNSKIPERT